MTASMRCRVVRSVAEIAPAVWDGFANPAGAPFNPFVSHAFFKALEDSGSSAARTGWRPAHLQLESEQDEILGLAPCFLKSHSQGEYVFDHGWADAYERAGGQYYPKLQVAVPFTPVPGPRLLGHRPQQLLAAAEAGTVQNGPSSAHISFIDEPGAG